MELKDIAQVKDTVEHLIQDRDTVTKQLKQLDADYKVKEETLLNSVDSQVEAYETKLKTDADNAIKAKEDSFHSEVKKLDDAKAKGLASIDEKIEKAKAEYLSQQQSVFNPLNDFKSVKGEIGQRIMEIPASSNFSQCELPKLESFQDLVRLNRQISAVTNLQYISNVSVLHHADKLTALLKPIDMLVDAVGGEYRWLIELGTIAGGIWASINYGMYIVPLITLPMGYVFFKRFKSFSLMQTHCKTYFQIANHEQEIRDAYENILLKDYQPELDNFKRTRTETINSAYNEELAKLQKLNQIDRTIIDSSALRQSLEDQVNLQFKDLLETRKKEEGELRTKLKFIGESIEKNLTKLRQYHEDCLHILDTYQGKGTLPEHIHWGSIYDTRLDFKYPYVQRNLTESLAIIYEDGDRYNALNFLKYLLLQNIVHCEPGLVKLHFMDSRDFCVDVKDMIVNNERLTNKYTTPAEIGDCLTNAVNEVQNRNLEVLRKYTTIEEYNKVMFSQDANLLGYEIIINLNTTKEQLLDVKHQALVKQASSCGIIVINLIDASLFQEQTQEKDRQALLQVISKHEKQLQFGKNTLIHGIQLQPNTTFIPIQLDKDKIVSVMDGLGKELEAKKPKALMLSEHRERNYNKMWNKIPTQGIDIQMGNLNGEKDKPVLIKLDNATPHGLIAGRSGSGKSVALNNIIMSICHQYSPDYVQIIGLDFKGTELLLYGKPYAMPHFRVVSATHDPNYVISIFDDLQGEMEARNKMYQDILGVKDYEEYSKLDKKTVWDKITDTSNKKLQTLMNSKNGKTLIQSMTKNRKYPILPRILFVIDEFAEMFLIQGDAPAIIKAKLKSLSKIGRSAGVHMLFASQNMEGTVSEDILEQFQLRICLPCSKNVSKSLIGNDKSAFIDRGYCIVNDRPEEGDKYNQLVKVPFDKTDNLKEQIKIYFDNGKRLGYTESVPIFDENEVFEERDLMRHVLRFTKLYEKNVYIIGESLVYQRRPVPVTMSLEFKERQNLSITAINRDLLNNLFGTVVENLKRKDYTFVVQNTDDVTKEKYDQYYLNDTRDNCKLYCNGSSVVNLQATLESTFRSRRDQYAKDSKVALPPCYFVLHGMENMEGFGIQGRCRLQDWLAENLLELNKYNVYFIFTSVNIKSYRSLLPYITHFLTGKLEERDSAYLPDKVNKALKGSRSTNVVYCDIGRDITRRIRPYNIFETEEVDEAELFSDEAM